MASSIVGSVGRWELGAQNVRADVETVQKLLTRAARTSNESKLDPRGSDGLVARPPRESATVKAIEAFQARFMSKPDGLIEIGGRTWRELLAAARDNAENPNKGNRAYFPLATLPIHNWTQAPRAFGSDRSHGKRAHAGCDLYARRGTWIYAITSGKVINGPYPFYAGTFAVEIDHGAFVARYCEIQGDAPVKTGEVVQAGQKIGQIGHMAGITVPSDMLHLELYDKSASGPLTASGDAAKCRDDGVTFGRRADLIDPTPMLDILKARLPKSY